MKEKVKRYLALGGLYKGLEFYHLDKEYKLLDWKPLGDDIVLITNKGEFYIRNCYTYE
jgi:hypothetical protein